MTLARVEQGEFRYVEAGDGPVVLMLHGLFGAVENFSRTIEHLSRRYRVTLLELPLYERLPSETHVHGLSDFIHRFCEHKAWSSITVIGNSLGGQLGLLYARSHPERVRSLVLAGSSGLYERSPGRAFFRRADYEFIKQKVAMTFYDPCHATKPLVDECFAMVNDRQKLARLVALARSSARRNMADELGSLPVPVCLIWGRQDAITPPHVAEEFHRRLPKSDLFWIDRCGHVPMVERPDAFNAALDQYWA